ncbi:DUF3987 domain-containing protein [Desulfovulcanus sp.]
MNKIKNTNYTHLEEVKKENRYSKGKKNLPKKNEQTNLALLKSSILQALEAGYSVIPCNKNTKQPVIKWKPYQNKKATPQEVDQWFSDKTFDAVAIVCGQVSKNLVIFDFDQKGEVFDQFCCELKKDLPELAKKLVIVRTQSGGYHLYFKYQGTIKGNEKLAMRKDKKILIETRGEGGYALSPPSPGYSFKKGSLQEVPIISENELETIYEIARSFNQYINPAKLYHPNLSKQESKPGDSYNQKADIRPLLEKHHWQRVGISGLYEQWRRPGKNIGCSASLIEGKIFYVFSTNAEPFEPNKAYSPFAVYALLEHNGDFSAAAKELVKQGYGNISFGCSNDNLPEPVKFWEPAESPEYPIYALPKIMAGAVQEYLDYAKVPPSMAATSCIAYTNLITQGLADVARDKHLIGPTSLNFLIIAESGERKSGCDAHFGGPLRFWFEEFKKSLENEVKRAQSRHQAWKAKKTGLQKNIEKLTSKLSDVIGNPKKEKEINKKIEALEQRLEELELQEPNKKIMPKLFYSDVNTASLANKLTFGYQRAMIGSDEGGIFVGSNGMTSEHVLTFLSFLNKLWDGGSYDSDRKMAKEANVRGRRVCANLMVQPAVYKKLTAGGLARGLGFLSRYLLAWPESQIGKRPYSEPCPMPFYEKFCARLTELAEIPLSLDNKDRLSPHILRLDAEAKTLWIQFYNEIEENLGKNKEFHEVKDFGAKIAENATRLAATFHVFEYGLKDKISKKTMLQAVEIVTWHLLETKKIFGLLERTNEQCDAEILLTWLLKSGKKEFRAAEILRAGPRRFRGHPKKRDKALIFLESQGFIIKCDSTARISHSSWKLHPKAPEVAHDLVSRD